MSSIVFCPWVGSKYWDENRFGVRILVLGESHYGLEKDKCSTTTTNVVRQLAQNQRDSFFTKVSKVLLGLDETTYLDDQRRGEIWEHVAFYNFIQTFVANQARIPPTAEMWEAAQEPFLEVLTKLAPDMVLVLGKELSKKLPTIPKSIKVCKINHPSSAFSYRQWNNQFSAAVQQTKQNA
jgi:hypothetical protein